MAPAALHAAVGRGGGGLAVPAADGDVTARLTGGGPVNTPADLRGGFQGAGEVCGWVQDADRELPAVLLVKQLLCRYKQPMRV